MKTSTLTALRAIVEADAPRTAGDRDALLRALGLSTAAPVATGVKDRLLSYAEAGALLGRCKKSVHSLCRDGALHKVKLPNRQRAAGIRQSEIERFVASLEG